MRIGDPPAHRVERLWPGETVVVVGGGPSVAGMDLSPIARSGARIIALNDAWRLLAADVLYFGDGRFWRWQGREILAGHRGAIATRSIDAARDLGERAWFLRWLYPTAGRRGGAGGGLTAERDAVAGLFAGHCGINLAVHLTGGPARYVLVGFDGRPAGTTVLDGVEVPRGNYHDRHRVAWHPGNFEKSVAELRTMAVSLAALGIEVVNATPGSAIDWWEQMPLAEALGAARKQKTDVRSQGRAG